MDLNFTAKQRCKDSAKEKEVWSYWRTEVPIAKVTSRGGGFILKEEIVRRVPMPSDQSSTKLKGKDLGSVNENNVQVWWIDYFWIRGKHSEGTGFQ